jgi:hypothetical protein
MDDASALVCHEGTPIARVTTNVPGDGLFDEELAELTADVVGARGSGRKRVLETLRGARQIVAVEALFGDGEVEATLVHVDPLWRWLFANRAGLVQADGEGYYELERRILRVR